MKVGYGPEAASIDAELQLAKADIPHCRSINVSQKSTTQIELTFAIYRRFCTDLKLSILSLSPAGIVMWECIGCSE